MKGTIELLDIDDKFKLLTLKELYGDNIFNYDSDLHIYGPDAVYVFGPEDRIVLEGDNYQFDTIVFSDEKGTLVYDSEGSREGASVNDTTGELVTIENGIDDTNYTVVALFVSETNKRFLDKFEVIIKKRVYPASVTIEGPGKISEETTEYT